MSNILQPISKGIENWSYNHIRNSIVLDAVLESESDSNRYIFVDDGDIYHVDNSVRTKRAFKFYSSAGELSVNGTAVSDYFLIAEGTIGYTTVIFISNDLLKVEQILNTDLSKYKFNGDRFIGMLFSETIDSITTWKLITYKEEHLSNIASGYTNGVYQIRSDLTNTLKINNNTLLNSTTGLSVNSIKNIDSSGTTIKNISAQNFKPNTSTHLELESPNIDVLDVYNGINNPVFKNILKTDAVDGNTTTQLTIESVYFDKTTDYMYASGADQIELESNADVLDTGYSVLDNSGYVKTEVSAYSFDKLSESIAKLAAMSGGNKYNSSSDSNISASSRSNTLEASGIGNLSEFISINNTMSETTRHHFDSESVGGYLYASPGKNDIGNNVQFWSRYKKETDSWASISATYTTSNNKIIDLNNYLYSTGGGYVDSTSYMFSEVYRYNHDSNVWDVRDYLNSIRSHHAGIAYDKDKILVSGGLGVSTSEVYNSSTNTWKEYPYEFTSGHGKHDHAIFEYDSYLISAYGNSEYINILNPESDTWSILSNDFSNYRTGSSLGYIDNIGLFSIGGVDSTSVSFTSVSVYNPILNGNVINNFTNAVYDGGGGSLFGSVYSLKGYNGSSYITNCYELRTYSIATAGILNTSVDRNDFQTVGVAVDDLLIDTAFRISTDSTNWYYGESNVENSFVKHDEALATTLEKFGSLYVTQIEAAIPRIKFGGNYYTVGGTSSDSVKGSNTNANRYSGGIAYGGHANDSAYISIVDDLTMTSKSTSCGGYTNKWYRNGETYNDRIYRVGGFDSTSGGLVSSVVVSDLETGSFYYVANSTTPFVMSNIGVINNKLYVTYNIDEDFLDGSPAGAPAAPHYSYDNLINTWSALATPGGAVLKASSVNDELIYVFGGATHLPVYYDNVYIYNVINNTWTQLLNVLPHNVAGCTSHNQGDGIINVYGGYNGGSAIYDFHYNTDIGTSTIIQNSIPDSITFYNSSAKSTNSALLGTDTVLHIGGGTYDGTPIPASWRYNYTFYKTTTNSYKSFINTNISLGVVNNDY